MSILEISIVIALCFLTLFALIYIVYKMGWDDCEIYQEKNNTERIETKDWKSILKKKK